ncbi:MAG: DUF5309 domain-containing protein, partial [Porphyromonadaceae bacterium]|nr:DUF5309 domain-containing protein [Porphyromonadaceae bacterium]
TTIRRRSWDVTHTQQQVQVAGIKNEVARQVMKAMKALLTDFEKTFLNTGNTAVGATATARQAKGLQKAIVSNTAKGTGTGNSATIKLTEANVNSLMAQIWNEGGNPRVLLCNEYQKRVISDDFTAKTGFSFNIDASTRKAIANINSYEGAFGTLEIIPDRFHMKKRITVIQPDQIKIAVLNDITQYKGAKVASADRGWCEAEMTIEWGNEKSHAKASYLKTSGAI